MYRKYLVIISLIIGIVATFIVYKNIPVGDVFGILGQTTPAFIAYYILAQLTMMGILAWRWQIIIRSQEHKQVPFWNLFWYRVIGYGVSYVTPTAKVGGEPVRAALLSRHNISFNKALSTVVIDKTIELTTSGVFFMVGAVILLLGFSLPQDVKIILISIVAVFGFIIFYFYYQMLSEKDFFAKVFRGLRLHKSKRGARWEKKIREFEVLVIKFYKRDKHYFMATIMLSLLSWAIMFIEYKIVLAIVGYPDASLASVFLIISLLGAAYLVPIPMALGSLEASQVSAFALTGMRGAAGVALALVVRAKDLAWAIIAFIALGFYGFKVVSSVKEAQPVTRVVKHLREEQHKK